MANICILCLISLNKVGNFYKDIKNKYSSKFPNYFKYFDKNDINENSNFKRLWNYNKNIYNNINNDLLFYTNNI